MSSLCSMFPQLIIKDFRFVNSSSPHSVASVFLRSVTEEPTETVTSASTLRFVYHFYSVFLFPLCVSLWIPSLEGHTRMFLVLASLTTYPDDASLNIACRAPSSEDGPWANIAAFVEWTLARNGYPFSTCSQEHLASATPDPVPSPPSPHCVERMPEPTADGEPEPAVTGEPSPHGATELRIAAELELRMMLVKVRELATTPALRENTTDGVSAERCSAPCTAAEGELSMACGLCQGKGEWAPVPEFSPRRAPVPAPQKHPPVPAPPECPSVSAPILKFSPGSPEAHKYPPSHPLLPPPPLSSGSPSARPQPTIYAVRARRDYHPPALPWSEFPSTPPPASEARTPPRPVDPSAPLWLLAPSSPPWPGSPLAPPGSLVPLASTILHLGTPLLRLRLVPPAPSGSFIPSAPPLSSVAPAPPRPPGSTPPHRSPAPSAPSRTSRSSPSPLLFGSPSPPWAPPPPAPPPLVGPLESAAIPPPLLLPPSAPPWATVMAVAWVPPGSSCSGSLLSLPWLLPPSSPPWFLSAGPLPGVRPPPEPPP